MCLTEVWEKGGDGAIDLAKKVVELSEKGSTISFVYDDNEPLKQKVKKVATMVYGAKDVVYTEKAEAEIEKLEKDGYKRFPVCIAKTQYSFSDDPKNLLCDKDYNIYVDEVVLRNGAEFVLVKCGKLFTMPGLPKTPAAERIKINNDGVIDGIF